MTMVPPQPGLTAEMTLLIIAGFLLSTGESARILGLVPFPARSHWIVMEPLFQELANRGHEVVVYSPFPQKKPLANYTDVDLSTLLPPMISAFSIEMIKEKMPNARETTHFMREIHENVCNVVFKEPSFQELWHTKEKYDLVITELFATDCFAYFAHKLKTPLISFTTSTSLPWGADRVGLPDNPAFIPNYLVNYTPDMSLCERVCNTLILLYTKFWHIYVFPKDTQALTEKMFGERLPPIQDVVSHTSLLFLNSHHSLAQSRPFPPNVIEVGGIHVKKQQPLPEDLKGILDSSKKGVIVMSFGSLVRSSTIPKSIIMMFLNAFSKIPQTIIFKYEEDLPEAPANVITRKWLPQRDLGEHENVLGIIAHGGLASTIEAVYLGKPIIGVPFFADQRVNVMSLVRRGAGVLLDMSSLTEQAVSNALAEIIHNHNYTVNMKQLSQQFRDRPAAALDTAVFWTEYVLRHKGAAHLRPVSVDLAWYQYLLLDVTAVLLLSLLVPLIALRYLARRFLLSSKLPHVKTSISKKTN